MFSKPFEKKEQENVNSIYSNLAFVKTNIPLTLENNCPIKENLTKSELDANEFLGFFYEEELQSNNNISYTIKAIPKRIKFVVKKKIFKINKILKRGRLKKNSNKIGKHNKYKTDNIIRKIKVQLSRSIYNYLNASFEVNQNKSPEKYVKVIKKISSHLIKDIKKVNTLDWLNSKVKDFFSKKISKRFYTCKDTYNEHTINKICKRGKEKKAIEILNKTIKEFLEIYVNGDTEKKYIGFDNINDDIKKFRKKGEKEKYIEVYTEIANNFERIFKDIIKSREKRQKK